MRRVTAGSVPTIRMTLAAFKSDCSGRTPQLWTKMRRRQAEAGVCRAVPARRGRPVVAVHEVHVSGKQKPGGSVCPRLWALKAVLRGAYRC